MKKSFILGLLLLAVVAISLYSCMHDDLPEQNTAHHTNASKFRLVRLKDIPQVGTLIHQKTRRQDFKISIPENSVLGKQSSEYVEIFTDAIAETRQGDTVWYTFAIKGMEGEDPDILYNLQIKQTEGTLESPRIVVYKASEGTSLDLDMFTGTVQSFSLDGLLQSGLDYNMGISPCPITEPGGGNGSGGSSGGGGGEGQDGSWNSGGGGGYHYPGDYGGTGGGNDGGGDGGGNGEGGGGDCTIGMNNQGQVVLICDGTTIPYNFKQSKLSSDCGEDPGVVIIPTKPQDPCEKMKTQNANPNFKAKVAALDKPEIFTKDIETGFAAAYGTVPFQQMANSDNGNVRLPDGNKYFGYMHAHLDKEGVVKIFSPYDIITFLTSCVRNAEQSGNMADAYAMVITSQGNYILMYTGDGSYSIGQSQIDNWKSWYDDEYSTLYMNDELTQPNVEKLFTQFLEEQVNVSGLEIYKSDKTTGNTNKLEYNGEDNPVQSIPCP